MESQMARPHGRTQEQMEGEDEHHHENKSVLKKVKAKAKKIKDTLTKHSHGHNHDHDHIPDDHDLDEDDDDDDDEEEMVDDPEIHAAPKYDAAVIKSVGTVDASAQSGINAGRSTEGGLVEDPAAPKDTRGPFTSSNYQTKVTNPTGKGGKEASGISPVVDSMDKMSIYDDPRPKSGHEQNWPTGTEDFHTSLPTGSHDQFSPELAPPKPVSEEKEQSVGGKDKGVSLKDYFAEKLRPGEGDKALSEVISEALHKKKAEQENKPASSRPVTEMISDALHKRKEEPNEAIDRPMGKVTESEEVARGLGTTDHDPSSKEGTNPSFVNNSGMGMVGKIKGAVGSWFGAKGEETQESQQSHSNSVGSDFGKAGHTAAAAGERRLQESGN